MKSNRYELVFITDPERSEEQLKEVTETIKGIVGKNGGSVETVEQWGKKRLAYAIKKQRYGYYTLFHFEAPTESISEIETNIKHNENILRWVVLDRHPKSASKPPVVETNSFYQNPK